MSRVVIALIVVLLPILAIAQIAPVPPLPVPIYPAYPIVPAYQRTFLNLEIKPGYQGASYSFKDQDISLKTSGGILELGASLITPGRCKLSAFLTTPRGVLENKTILGSFVIGATEFGAAGGGSTGAAATTKSISLDFKTDPDLRFEVASMIPNLPMQPLVVFQRSGYSITATSINGGTTQKRDTERGREWDTAIGAECPIYGPGWRAAVKCAAGMDMVYISFGYDIRWDRQLFLGFSVDHQRINYDRGTRRYTAGFLRLGAEF